MNRRQALKTVILGAATAPVILGSLGVPARPAPQKKPLSATRQAGLNKLIVIAGAHEDGKYALLAGFAAAGCQHWMTVSRSWLAKIERSLVDGHLAVVLPGDCQPDCSDALAFFNRADAVIWVFQRGSKTPYAYASLLQHTMPVDKEGVLWPGRGYKGFWVRTRTYTPGIVQLGVYPLSHAEQSVEGGSATYVNLPGLLGVDKRTYGTFQIGEHPWSAFQYSGGIVTMLKIG
jgi:hypothetical protein